MAMLLILFIALILGGLIIILCLLKKNKDKTKYKFTMNVVFSAIAWIIFGLSIVIACYFMSEKNETIITPQYQENIPYQEENESVTEEPSSETSKLDLGLKSILIITAGAGIALLLIWGTSKSQYAYEVEMQMKEEEKQKIIEKNT